MNVSRSLPPSPGQRIRALLIEFALPDCHPFRTPLQAASVTYWPQSLLSPPLNSGAESTVNLPETPPHLISSSYCISLILCCLFSLFVVKSDFFVLAYRKNLFLHPDIFSVLLFLHSLRALLVNKCGIFSCCDDCFCLAAQKNDPFSTISFGAGGLACPLSAPGCKKYLYLIVINRFS
jgi:hypothetical protein